MTGACTTRTDRRVKFFFDLDRWERFQRASTPGVPLPLEHRASWLKEVSPASYLFIALEDTRPETTLAAVPVQRRPTRALPGHYRLRVTRFGHGVAVDPAVLSVIPEVLRDLVESRSTFLSVTVEVFDASHHRRNKIAEMMQNAGFVRHERQRRYRYTPRLDLTLKNEELFASFSGSCRRFIRDPAKKGCRVESVREGRWARRMEELWKETFARTGSVAPPRAWRKHLAYARAHPHLYRIVGTFGPDYPAEGSLLAFCCAMNNGDHAVYSDGASTRELDTTVALMYAPMWDLVKWSKSKGCQWFDMGGIAENSDEADPGAGIADFKRRFAGEVIDVGGEWRFRSPSVRSAVADGVSTAASAVREVFGLLRRHR